jgi:thiol-disulfide isomerase/thioredoxin
MKQIQGFGAVGVVGIVAAVLIVGAVGFILNNSNTNKEKVMMAEKTQMEEKALMEQKAMEENAMMEKETLSAEDDKMMDDGMMEKDESTTMQKAGVYAAYSEDSLAMAQKGKTVLFFHASWCPSCRGADADIQKNSAAIPAGVTILKTDYDTEIALKQKYGVTTQHTFVEIDSAGTLVQKWSGGDFANIITKI